MIRVARCASPTCRHPTVRQVVSGPTGLCVACAERRWMCRVCGVRHRIYGPICNTNACHTAYYGYQRHER